MLFDRYIAPAPPTVLARGILVHAVEPYRFSNCFIDLSVFKYPGVQLRHLRTRTAPAVADGLAVTYNFGVPMHFWEMAQFILGTDDKNQANLSVRLIEANKTFSPKQVEELITSFERGDRSSQLQAKGHVNFFFVHDESMEVSILVAWKLEPWLINVRTMDALGGDGAYYRLVTRT